MSEPGGDPGEQLALMRSSARASRAKAKPVRQAAAEHPVATVAVDVSLAHLDRPFDFLVPEQLAETAQPGVRVRVRFAGRLLNGFVLQRTDGTEHGGRLAYLDRVVSPEPVLTPEIMRLARSVADRYAGSLADVLRLAVPPRHAGAEAAPQPADAGPPDRPDPGGWHRYEHGPGLLDAVHAGATVRAVWSALPGPGWPDELARLLVTAAAGGRGALAVLPDHRDVARVGAALERLTGPEAYAVLTAEPGPAARYRTWLRVLRGQARVVVGTRAAMFAPVRDLGLAVVWDDGDDLHAEPRAPYPHVRSVLALRSTTEGSALVVGGLSRSVEAAALVSSGWARPVEAPRAVVRQWAPGVVADGGADHVADEGVPGVRLPTSAWRAVRQALERGPVLVQVPRRGYRPGLACQHCRAPARCVACRGPLGSTGSGPLACGWCAAPAAGWSCPACGGRRLRATTVGAARTAEELGQAFPRTPVRESGGDGAVLATVGAKPALVVATPGAEPVAEGGYAAAVLLDGRAVLARPDLRAGEEALRRWTAAAALVRPGSDGGAVVVVAEPAAPAVQALVRWDQPGFAARELAERAALRLPPDSRLVEVSGSAEAVAAFLAALSLPAGVELLGPVPTGDDTVRVLLRIPRPAAAAVAALKAALGARSVHKDTGPVRVRVDPLDVG